MLKYTICTQTNLKKYINNKKETKKKKGFTIGPKTPQCNMRKKPLHKFYAALSVNLSDMILPILPQLCNDS